jgi:hypothetical protein
MPHNDGILKRENGKLLKNAIYWIDSYGMIPNNELIFPGAWERGGIDFE